MKYLLIIMVIILVIPVLAEDPVSTGDCINITESGGVCKDPTPEVTKPAGDPTIKPTEKPTEEPTEKPTEEPTEKPTEKPTEEPTEKPIEPTIKPVPKISDVNAISMTLVVNELQWSKKQITFSVIKSISDFTDFSKTIFADPDTGAKYIQLKEYKSNTETFKDDKYGDVQMKMTDISLIDESFSKPEFVKKQWAVAYQTDDGMSIIIRGNTE
jgi:hypothetical protein